MQPPIVPSDEYTMIWDESGLAAHYLGDRLEADFPRHYGGFLFFEKGRLLGCTSIYDYRENGGNPTAFIVGAAESPRIWSRRNIRDMTSMFFDDPPYGLGLNRLNSFVTVDNEHSIKITERLGFKREGLMRKGGPEGKDIIVFGLLEEDLTWHRKPDDTPAQSDDTPSKAVPHAEDEMSDEQEGT